MCCSLHPSHKLRFSFDFILRKSTYFLRELYAIEFGEIENNGSREFVPPLYQKRFIVFYFIKNIQLLQIQLLQSSIKLQFIKSLLYFISDFGLTNILNSNNQAQRLPKYCKLVAKRPKRNDIVKLQLNFHINKLLYFCLNKQSPLEMIL